MEAAELAEMLVGVRCCVRLKKRGWPCCGSDGGAGAAGALVLPIVITGVDFNVSAEAPRSAIKGTEYRSREEGTEVTAAKGDAECRVGVRPAEGMD